MCKSVERVLVKRDRSLPGVVLCTLQNTVYRKAVYERRELCLSLDMKQMCRDEWKEWPNEEALKWS